jgi:hypothetical protein
VDGRTRIADTRPVLLAAARAPIARPGVISPRHPRGFRAAVIGEPTDVM